MTEPTPLYSGEAILKRWGDSSSGGRTVTFQIDGEGPHPLKGYEGERFMVVCVPIGNDDKPMTKQVTRSVTHTPGKAGDTVAATVASGSPKALADVPPPASNSKPKRHWRDMPPSQRAALMLAESDFPEYLSKLPPRMYFDGNDEQWLLAYCGVERKRAFDADTYATAILDRIYDDFQAYRQAKGHGQI